MGKGGGGGGSLTEDLNSVYFFLAKSQGLNQGKGRGGGEGGSVTIKH